MLSDLKAKVAFGKPLADVIDANQQAMKDMEAATKGIYKPATVREKVDAWLDSIQCTDQAERDEVLDHCAKDAGARAYYVGRYNEKEN